MNTDITNVNFNNTWNIWYHHMKDLWTIDGYRNIHTINNAVDFWKLYNNWNLIGGINYKHFFIMKDNVKPIWEDTININGGCWSFKVADSMAHELWEDLSILLVTNEIMEDCENCEVVGLSISGKKNNTSVVKIWNTNSSYNSIKYINKNILKKWKTDIIYIAHMPEKNKL
jgi:hypothetical protein